MKSFKALFFCLAALPSLDAVIVDGLVNEWNNLSVETVTDPVGDPTRSGPDFTLLEATNDGYNLYLRIEFAQPINLRSSDLRLFLDADDDPDTGFPFDGRGMDLNWDFDRNRGTYSLASRSDVGRGNIISWIAPYESSQSLEVAISLEVLPAVREGRPIHLFLTEDNSRDRIPDSGSPSV